MEPGKDLTGHPSPGLYKEPSIMFTVSTTFSRRLLLLLLPLLIASCKNSIDSSSCRQGCNDPYFPCMEQALLYDRSPNGESAEARQGGVMILWLGCETDKAICKTNCARALSAQ